MLSDECKFLMQRQMSVGLCALMWRCTCGPIDSSFTTQQRSRLVRQSYIKSGHAELITNSMFNISLFPSGLDLCAPCSENLRGILFIHNVDSTRHGAFVMSIFKNLLSYAI